MTFSLISIAVIIGLVLVANAQTFFRVIKSLIFSQRKHLQGAIAKLDVVKSEGYLQAVKGEVQLMVNMVKTLDAFTGYQTRSKFLFEFIPCTVMTVVEFHIEANKIQQIFASE